MKKIILLVCFLCTVCIFIPVRAEAATDPAPVSPGLLVLAERFPMAKAGLAGAPLSFSAEDFGRAVNLASVRTVTVTRTPSPEEGELRLGNVVVNRGQTIHASALENLSYVSARGGVRYSSFGFTVNDSPVEITCQVFMLNAINHAPTLESVPKTALSVSTHKNVTLWGELPSYDPDGDGTVVEIVSYPKYGILLLTDASKGEYTYTPSVDRVGKDSFSYVVRDTYGNYSASATVSLQILRPASSLVFADMRGEKGENAALRVTEAGIMSGTPWGMSIYFEPDRAVSRVDFVVMAMKAMGVTDPGNGVPTAFVDWQTIPEESRGYIAAAYGLGYIQGEPTASGLCFHAERSITRAEAAVILGRMVNAATPTLKPVFEDAREIPAFAQASVYSVAALGLLNDRDGNIEPMEPVTRLDAAEILSALLSYRE